MCTLCARTLETKKCLQRMSKANSVVAIVTQQSRQRLPQSRTEYRECPKATWVQTARWADDQRWSLDDDFVPSCREECNHHLDTEVQYWWGSYESKWWIYLRCSGTPSQWRLSCISCVKPQFDFLVPVRMWAAVFIACCSLQPRRERHVTLQRHVAADSMVSIHS